MNLCTQVTMDASGTLQKTCQGKTLDAKGLCHSAMGAAGSYTEAA